MVECPVETLLQCFSFELQPSCQEEASKRDHDKDSFAAELQLWAHIEVFPDDVTWLWRLLELANFPKQFESCAMLKDINYRALMLESNECCYGCSKLAKVLPYELARKFLIDLHHLSVVSGSDRVASLLEQVKQALVLVNKVNGCYADFLTTFV